MLQRQWLSRYIITNPSKGTSDWQVSLVSLTASRNTDLEIYNLGYIKGDIWISFNCHRKKRLWTWKKELLFPSLLCDSSTVLAGCACNTLQTMRLQVKRHITQQACALHFCLSIKVISKNYRRVKKGETDGWTAKSKPSEGQPACLCCGTLQQAMTIRRHQAA